jgi:hypothetical protein
MNRDKDNTQYFTEIKKADLLAEGSLYPLVLVTLQRELVVSRTSRHSCN